MSEILFQDLALCELTAATLDNTFGIEDKVFLQLYAFYKTHTQKAIYFVDASEASRSDEFSMSDVNRYYEYGIRFKNSSGVVSNKRAYLLIIPAEVLDSEESLVSYCEQQKELLGNVFFKACIIEKDYSLLQEAQKVEDILIINKVLAGTFICNFNEMATTANTSSVKKIKKRSGYDYIDVSALFKKYNCFGIDFKSNLLSIQKITEEIKELHMSSRKKTIFYLSDGNDSEYKVFTVISAVLTVMEHINFDVHESYMQLFLFMLRRFHHRRFNFISDFLRDLQEPLEIAATITERRAFLCTLDVKTLAEKEHSSDYQILLNIVGAPFDLEKMQLVGNCSNHTYSLNRIEILDIQKLFSVDSGGLEEFCKLNKLIDVFETNVLRFLNGSSEILLNCSNVLLYRYRGEVYLGYVSYIGGKLPYIFYPVSANYTSFSVDLSVEEYQALYDIAIFAEHDNIVKSFIDSKRIIGDKVHYPVMKHFRGALFGAIPTQAVKLDESCGFSLEELGIWSTQAAYFRDDKELRIINMLNQKTLRQVSLATFFGGPHPFLCVHFTLENNMWR